MYIWGTLFNCPRAQPSKLTMAPFAHSTVLSPVLGHLAVPVGCGAQRGLGTGEPPSRPFLPMEHGLHHQESGRYPSQTSRGLGHGPEGQRWGYWGPEGQGLGCWGRRGKARVLGAGGARPGVLGPEGQSQGAGGRRGKAWGAGGRRGSKAIWLPPTNT